MKKINLIIAIILVLGSGTYLGYNILYNNDINKMFYIISSGIIFVISITYLLKTIFKDKNIYNSILLILLIGFVGFNFGVNANIIKLKQLDTLPNFVSMSLSDANIYSAKNDIELEIEYIYSDTYEENIIISQDITPGTLLDGIKKIKLIISKGPNYNEKVIVPIMTDWDVDKALDFINKNHLNNVIINYEISDSSKNLLINQSKNGEIARNEELTLTFSLGPKENLTSVNMINLKNKSLFDATLWLKQSAITYNITYEYSDSIKRGFVISTDKAIDDELIPFETIVNIVVSKGKQIKVPNLINMTSEEIINWVQQNNLKIEFAESYSSTIAKGKNISSNYNENDIIEEGTLISMVISKGVLVLEKVDNLKDLRSWATKYEIKLDESFKFSDTVKSGNVISIEPNFGTAIEPTDVIRVTVSNGSGIAIPNFVGKTKTYITSKCNALGLKCTYKYGNYSDSTAKDVATGQNKTVGAKVISGTSITITLSKGKATTYSIVIQDSWFTSSITSYDSGVSMLKGKLSNLAPEVSFNYIKKSCNSLRPGYIHQSSPIKGGTNISVKAGNTYEVWICG